MGRYQQVSETLKNLAPMMVARKAKNPAAIGCIIFNNIVILQFKLMISSQKFRLFLNDPKFKEVKVHTRQEKQSKELALNKVYPGQKQIHRNEVIMDSIRKKKNSSLAPINQDINFLQSRVFSFQNSLITDIENTYDQKEKIKLKHVNIEQMHQNTSQSLQTILLRAASNEQLEEDREIDEIENTIEEIDYLYRENQKLKIEIGEIEKRIKYKKARLQNP